MKGEIFRSTGQTHSQAHYLTPTRAPGRTRQNIPPMAFAKELALESQVTHWEYLVSTGKNALPGEEVAAGPRAGFLPCDLPARRKEASHRPHDAEPAASEGFCLCGDRDEAELKLLAEVTRGRGLGILSSGSRKLVLPAKWQTALKQLMLHASKC